MPVFQLGLTVEKKIRFKILGECPLTKHQK